MGTAADLGRGMLPPRTDGWAPFLQVLAPEAHRSLAGFYEMVVCNNRADPREGYPSWKQSNGEAVICCGDDGCWQFSPDVIHAAMPHNGRPPHEVVLWEAWDEQRRSWVAYPRFQ